MSRLALLVVALAGPALAQDGPQRLAPAGLEAFSHFGIALDAGTDVLAVGATGTTAPGDDEGAVFVYVQSPGAWTLAQRLVAPSVVGTGYVGASVDVSPDGRWLIAGAPLDETEGIGTGAAFVWRLDGGTWTFDAKLVADDAEAFDEFGQDVAISDDGEALVGAPFEGDGPTGGGNGAAYLFTRATGGGWTQTAKLQPPDLPAGATFGRAVSIDAGFAAVGAPVPGPFGLPQPPTDPGYVYVFAREASGAWTQTQRLTGDDSVNGDFFGGAVDLLGGRLAVGANQDQDAGPVTGAVYVFEQGGVAFAQTDKLVPAGAESQDGIGFAVAFAADGTGRLVFSALGDDDGGENAGAVYVYRPCSCGGDWIWDAKLLGTGSDDRYGWSVGADGADVVVGAYTDSAAGFASGAAYAYDVPFVLADTPPVTAGELAVGAARPHPAAEGATFTITGAGEATVEVVDALGRTVAHLGSVTAAPGRPATVTLPDLAPGVYAVVARQGAATATRVVVVGR